MSKLGRTLNGALDVIYPLFEGKVDAEITGAAQHVADFASDKAEATANNDWDNEGLEKIEIFFAATAERLKERREAFVAQKTGTDDAGSSEPVVA